MMPVGIAQPWYHGSPCKLAFLRHSSTITQDRRLAMVFSHKPTIVSAEDDSRLRHNGVLPGFLYEIAETVHPVDIIPHPHSSIPTGWEWLTTGVFQIGGDFASSPQSRGGIGRPSPSCPRIEMHPLTTRELRVTLVEPVLLEGGELLSPEEIVEFKQKAAA